MVLSWWMIRISANGNKKVDCVLVDTVPRMEVRSGSSCNMQFRHFVCVRAGG